MRCPHGNSKVKNGAGTSQHKPQVLRPGKKNNTLLIAVGALILVAVFGYGIFFWNVNRQPGKEQQGNEKLQSQTETPEQQKNALEQESSEDQQLNQNTQGDLESGEQSAADNPENDAEQADADAPIIKLDMEQTPAGTIVEETQIDRTQLASCFCAYPISDEVYQRINGKSYRENNDIGLDDLRYLKLLHYNFDHRIQMGELIVNADVAEDMTRIFEELFDAEYEIQTMYLIDNYWAGDGDSTDQASIEVNNTSAFCYRQITGSSSLSNHAYGRAIDINPQQNPYVSYRSGSPVWFDDNADKYIARDTGLAHVITHEDLCFQTFVKYGFAWGGDWNTIKDYQHFEKE